MTTYFTAPDGENEPTLWLYTDDPRYPVAILRMRDLGPLHGHWDELVARVIAGNPSAARNKLANAIDDLTRTPSPPSQGLMQVMPVGNPDAQQMSWREALRNPQDHEIEWGTPVDRRWGEGE